jgi:inward rectifier potassium channel
MAIRARAARVRPDPRKGQFPQIRSIGRPWEPHKDIYHFLLKRSWAGFFCVVVLGFLLTNAAFGLLYASQPEGISNARPGSFEDAFFFSVQTMATIGYGTMAPVTRFAHVIVTVEAMVGILSVALVTGITFSKFSRPSARIVFSDKMVIAPRNGVPHLMFRLANWRHNQVLEAQLRLILLVTEKTTEGETLRRPYELPLVRDRNALFSLTWLAMHKIDEHSPFFGPDALARLRAQGAQLFVSLYGLDETVGQNIHARYPYSLDDVVWNARFKDLLTDLPDGTRQLNYINFHDIDLLPVTPPPPSATKGDAPAAPLPQQPLPVREKPSPLSQNKIA